MYYRPKNSKYGAIKTKIDGITFSSKKEASRYYQLKLLERAGKIRDLQLQPRFELQPAFKYKGKIERKIEYVADFKYTSIEDRKCFVTVEDSKGFVNPVYAIKRKLFLKQYGSLYNFIES